MRYPFAFERSYELAARPFGITPARAWVEVDDRYFSAQYGRWKVHFPLANIRRVAITGPYLFAKTAGSPRLGLTDRGVTFASNGQRGIELQFHEPIRCVGPFKHPNLTVTVADIDGLHHRLVTPAL